MPEDEFDPSKPFADKEDEEEVQSTFRKRERLRHLESEAQKKREAQNPPKKKRSGWAD